MRGEPCGTPSLPLTFREVDWSRDGGRWGTGAACAALRGRGEMTVVFVFAEPKGSCRRSRGERDEYSCLPGRRPPHIETRVPGRCITEFRRGIAATIGGSSTVHPSTSTLASYLHKQYKHNEGLTFMWRLCLLDSGAATCDDACSCASGRA